jgi:hypothetical protein
MSAIDLLYIEPFRETPDKFPANSRSLQNGLIFFGLSSILARFGLDHATFPNTKDLGLDALPEVFYVF